MTDVIMPQMGESIAEGTVTKWMKNVGDKVERDEPLFEISTDKVDAEIPSPAAGILREIRVEAGSTVGINTVVAVIVPESEVAAPQPAAPAPAPPVAAPPRSRASRGSRGSPSAGGSRGSAWLRPPWLRPQPPRRPRPPRLR